MICNICDFKIFEDFNGRPNAMCGQCGSLERTRLVALYLDLLSLRKHPQVLHIAPERGLSELLADLCGKNGYRPVDFDPGRYPEITGVKKIDLCDLCDETSDKYDLIIHSHVLEHTPCNIAYTLFHLHRMLTKTGRHIFAIPFVDGGWDEQFSGLDREERVARFGQWDHVRCFGTDDLDDHIGTLFNTDRIKPLSKIFSKDTLTEHAIPTRCWYKLCPESLIDLGKTDLLFFR